MSATGGGRDIGGDVSPYLNPEPVLTDGPPEVRGILLGLFEASDGGGAFGGMIARCSEHEFVGCLVWISI